MRLRDINSIFETNPELEKTGTKTQYYKYLKTIFPESQVKDIVYHGSITKEGFEDYSLGKSKEFNYSHNAIFATSSLEDAKTGGTGSIDKKDFKVLYWKINLPKYNTGILRDGSVVNKAGDFFEFKNKKELEKAIKKSKDIWKEIKWKYEKVGDNSVKITKPDECWHKIGVWKDNKLIMDLSGNIGYLGDINEEKVSLLKEEGLTGVLIEDANMLGKKGRKEWYLMFNPNQVHSLGSKKDVEKFKEFVQNQSSKHSLEKRLAISIFAIFTLFGLIFSTNSLTGNVVGITNSSFNFSWTGLLVISLVGLFLTRRYKK